MEVSAPEAAVRLGRSREAVIRAVQKGELSGRLEGGRWVVRLDNDAARPGIEPVGHPAPAGAR